MGKPKETKEFGRAYGTRNSKTAKPKKICVGDVFEASFGTFRNEHQTDAAHYTFRFKGEPFGMKFEDIKLDGITWPLSKSVLVGSAFHDIKIGTGEMAKPAPPGIPVELNSQISVKPINFEVTSVYVNRFGNSAIHVAFVVPDRKTGAPLHLTYNHAILPITEKNYIAEQTMLAIIGAFEHEVREMLYLDQERFRDPHPEVQQLQGLK